MQIRIKQGQPYPLGTYPLSDGMNISYVSEDSDCGIVLFHRDTEEEIKRIPFLKEYSLGNIYYMKLQGIPYDQVSYCFYEKDEFIMDTRGKSFLDGYEYGQSLSSNNKVRLAVFPDKAFEWGEDKNPQVPYEQSVVYCLHVRGFTKHSSSKVKGKGTFLGVIEKIPYLKDLGVTTLEFQPIYEFDELEKKCVNSPSYICNEQKKLNYWGYKEGYYYSPKNSYSYSRNPMYECMNMILELHKAGIEVIMQFYFTDMISVRDISEILRYWVKEYHIDGFHLKGCITNIEYIISDPALAKTKIWYYGFPNTKTVKVKYLAEYTDQYRYDMRKFLKSDEGLVKSVMNHLVYNPDHAGQINYLTNYDGFTLMDLVSYDRKHNEENGDDNKDGNDYNNSWNCGQEGKSRKQSVIRLRKKQIKNALLLLFLSQGTPLFFMGDEFGNTQEGNNNPYCLDSNITWLNWKQQESEQEIYGFVKSLILLRKQHPVLRQSIKLRLMDYGACGYPDASFHGEFPWTPDISPYSRQFGMMYCGKYAWKDRKTPDDFFYIAYNLHWEKHSFALPKIPKELSWKKILSSDPDSHIVEGDQVILEIPERCICVLASVSGTE